MYPAEREIKYTTESNTSASYLNPQLSIGREGQLRTSLYGKRNDFNFYITNFPFLSSNCPSSPAMVCLSHNSYGMQGFAPLMNVLFWVRREFHVRFSGRDILGNVWNHPSGSDMFDMGISSNIIKSPSPKCYMTFWDIIIYSDTHHWSGMSLIRDIVSELDFITVFTLFHSSGRFS